MGEKLYACEEMKRPTALVRYGEETGVRICVVRGIKVEDTVGRQLTNQKSPPFGNESMNSRTLAYVAASC